MKKKLLGVVAVVVIAVVAVIGIKLVLAPKEIPLANILPKETSFYYSIQNLETIWKDIKSSNFWRQFSNLNFWQDIQIAGGIQDLKNQFKENIGIDLTEENFLKLTGKDFTIAIIPSAEQAKPPKIILLARGDKKQGLTGIVNPIIEKVKKEDPTKVEETQYKGEKISHIKSASADQPNIYFTLHKNILIAGIGDTLPDILQILDISSGSVKESLASSENYKKIIGPIAKQKELAGLFYMDFTKMRNLFQALSIPGPEGAAAQTKTGLETINYIGGWTEIKDGLITKLYVYPNIDALTPEMKKMWQAKPEVPAVLKFTPEKVLLYIDSNSIDLCSIWDLWQANLKTQAAAEQIQPVLDNLASFETEWGLNIKNDILSLAGNEAAFIFSDIGTEGLLPVPKLGLAVKITDKEKTDKLIADLINKNNELAEKEAAEIEKTVTETPTAEESPAEGTETESPAQPSLRIKLNLKDVTYEGHPIKTLQLPLIGTGLAPGYTYIDDFLVIGATTKTLEEMLDVRNGKVNNLMQDKVYQKLSAVLPKENNQSVFINLERLMEIGENVCGWMVGLQQLNIPQGPPPADPKELELYNQQKSQAEATIAIINNNVIPLLKTLKAIKFIATASVNKKDYIEQTIIMRVEDI